VMVHLYVTSSITTMMKHSESKHYVDVNCLVLSHREDEVPSLHSKDKVRSISMYTRPALDSPSAFIDRVWMAWSNTIMGSSSEASPEPETEGEVLQTVADVDWRSGKATPTDWKLLQNRVAAKCGEQMENLKQCTSEQERAVAAQMLDLCFGAVACRAETKKYMDALELDQGQDQAEHAVQECVLQFKQAMRKVCREAKVQGSH